MTLHEMSISAIQQALSAGELSAHEIARQTLDAMRATRRSTHGPTSPKSACWPRPTTSIPCVGKAPLPPLAGVPTR
jgi:aspartyl-tRNA(Asn)/glutamyl-tRNA(Gln) amidotransferase subunit A